MSTCSVDQEHHRATYCIRTDHTWPSDTQHRQAGSSASSNHHHHIAWFRSIQLRPGAWHCEASDSSRYHGATGPRL